MKEIYYWISFGASWLITIILFIAYNYQFFKRKNKTKEELRKEYEKDLKQLIELIEKSEIEAANLQKEIEQKQTFNSSLLKIREEELHKLLESEKEKEEARIKREIDDWAKSAQEVATAQRDEIFESYQEEIDKEYEKLRELYMEINEYKAQRDAINQEILRSRAINEKQDFYRIQLDENSKHDIDIINSIRPQIFKFETLNKLLYDNYISRPAKEMVKRVLEGKNPSGIYKVTNIETQEIYIGKSTSVGDRWINHVKSACGLDGVADSQFQRALKQYGVDNFTWELLEEVPKDKLTEREKYYISFYDTVHYGYNMKVG